tara:strand:+ start:242 stop:541 length:300 start_codon:yes stop_codon:yes gene_type:complete
MERLEYLKKELKHITSVNRGSPFPLFDTEYVELVTQEIINMKDKIITDYDDTPVISCKHCKSLFIKVDEHDNNLCMKCGSINEVIEHDNIFEYKNKYNK